MKGIFGSLFDWNHDGKRDWMENAMEAAFIKNVWSSTPEAKTELELSGLDPTELEFMCAAERREALEDAGLDPDEYDF